MYQPLSKKLSRAILVGLMAALPACSTVQTVRESPSPELLRHCPEPIVSVRTNGELAEATLAYKDALQKCNIDKAALREWASDVESP